MKRWLPVLSIMVGTLSAQNPPSAKPPDVRPPVQEQEPPEEDEGAKPKEYSFNPLQAAKEIKIGDYYLKKGSYRAAADRYREATRWNGTLADAFLKLGEAEEKLKDPKAAREAYARYIEMAPASKNVRELKKKIARM